MGNAGIVRELLRFARVARGDRPDYAMPLPDHVGIQPSARKA